MKKLGILVLFSFCSYQQINAQIQVQGTVYDSIGVTPVPLVSVLTSSGRGAVTDAQGQYSVYLGEKDSIWFSYLNKPTRKFAIKDIPVSYAFDISLKISIPLLPEARVRSRDYKSDSIRNRLDYARVFDFQKPGLSIVSGNGGVGVDLTELINAFRFRRTRNMMAFQRRLLNEERDAFITHRFSKSLIRRITPLDNDSIINNFILLYQPSYLFTATANDYDFHKYIKESYDRFILGLKPPPLWREGEINDDY